MEQKRLSNLMLFSNFISGLFYSTSYPYIYAETVKVIPRQFLGLEQILCCISTIIFCKLWNKYSDRFFNHYKKILWAEVIADIILFSDVLIRGDLSFYFLFNILIYSLITRNLTCGGTKMRAKVNPTEKLREQYDNNNQIVSAIATLLGAGFAIICPLDLTVLFIFALIGNIVDNFFYLYIYNQIKRRDMNENTTCD